MLAYLWQFSKENPPFGIFATFVDAMMNEKLMLERKQSAESKVRLSKSKILNVMALLPHQANFSLYDSE